MELIRRGDGTQAQVHRSVQISVLDEAAPENQASG
jgi:hypothetical protein